MFTRSMAAMMLLAVLCSAAAADTPTQLSEIAGWKGANVNGDQAFRFVVVSDRTGNAMKGKWAEAVEHVNLLKPDFVISVGDLIQGYTEDANQAVREWEEFEAMTAKFDAPFFYCPGNHDATNDVLRKLYRQRHGVNGKSYYSFDYRGCHFVILDSWAMFLVEESRNEQLSWLAGDMAAAKDARHVFVFYHNPAWENEKVWPRLRELLPAGKTTIFNGHTHTLGHHEDDNGIPTYVLGPTATHSGTDLLTGKYRMFAQVTVDAGEPTIAILPMDTIRPIEFAKFVTALRGLSSQLGSVVISAKGGRCLLQQPNSLPGPVTVKARWHADGWDVTPNTIKLQIEPGQTATLESVLTPQVAVPPRPELSITYSFFDPYSRQQAQIMQKVRLGVYASMSIPRISDIVVDGRLDDFKKVPPLGIADKSRVFDEPWGWSGPKDSSFELRLATDGERLFVAADVTDDEIRLDHTPWRNDSVLFFWDARPPAKRTGRQGRGTGYVRFAVPAEGTHSEATYPSPVIINRPGAPVGVKAACRRRDGGYVIEWSIPLSELGVATPLAAGQTMLFEAVCTDRDYVDGKPLVTAMSTSGLGNSRRVTQGYIRCTFE